jgi:CMP-N-acetylneuraminic acid synthetase
MDKFFALVPMKSHSERVKNKNIRDMAGMPLFYYILKTLEKCRHVSEIYVDTDSELIKEHINRDFADVKIIARPAHLIGDAVPMNKIIEYDLSQIDGDLFLQTHSTNPLLTSKTIENAVEFFLSHPEYNSLFSVTKSQKRFYNSEGAPVNHDPKTLLNTQELDPLFEENSCIYLFTRNSFSANKNRIGERPRMFEINKIEAIDIDDEFDFKLVKAIMSDKKKAIKLSLSLIP